MSIILLGGNMEIENKIKETIDNLRPFLNLDGGDIEFIKYENKILYIKLTGNCAHCLMQDETINNGILNLLKEEIAEIENIINITL